MSGENPSEYLKYLPAIFQDDPFLGRFLKGFEDFLSGNDDGAADEKKGAQGIEQVIERISTYFNPGPDPSGQAPGEFVKWLAGWVALVLRGDWDVETQRRLIKEIVSLYPLRGTRLGLERYLKIYAGSGVKILDQLTPFQIGDSSTVGVNTIIGGLPPHFFIVNVAFDTADPEKLRAKAGAVEAVLELEKPAHTYYLLTLKGPTMRVGSCHVGKDTMM